MMYTNNWEFKVRFGETDAAGIVFYPNFYKWMDQATQEMFESMGYPTTKLIADKLGLPLVEAHCQFRIPLHFSDRVRLESTVEEVKSKVFKVKHVFYRGEELIAEGYEVRAWVSLAGDKIKAEPIPDGIREILLSTKNPQ